jgi:hypothetical protein
MHMILSILKEQNNVQIMFLVGLKAMGEIRTLFSAEVLFLSFSSVLVLQLC